MRCEKAECVPEVGCDIGHPDLAECTHFKEAKPADDSVDALTSVDTIRMPWTGRTMGERDIAYIAAATYPTIVSLIGPHDAGKTTLLAALFLAICEGMEPASEAVFAGSCSFAGWQDVSARMRIDADGAAQFPLHTPDSASRIPGLLHLCYRQSSKAIEILLTDAPGEWFTRWATERFSTGAQGAEWIAKNARRHLVIADSEALSGQDSGLAREQFERIVGRLADIQNQNVALVWTKSDVSVPASMKEHIERSYKRRFADTPVFHTRLPLDGEELKSGDPCSLRAILDWMLAPEVRTKLRPAKRRVTEDPFLSIGAGW